MADKLITIDELLKLLDKYNHRELHVHHTWRPDHSNFNGSNYQKVQDGMRRSHLARGFSDIAQHVTLFPDGIFMTGRNFGTNPASILNHNYGLPFCVEMIGNFDIGNDKFEGIQKDSMLKLAKYFYNKGKYVRFHNENAAKTCPGTSIKKSTFMSEVKGYKDNGIKVEAPKTQVKTEVVYNKPTSTLLGKGNRGEAVKTLQSLLNKKGFNVGTVDGVFGDKTEDALIAFQKEAGIGVDGIYGQQSKKSLENYKKASSPTPTPSKMSGNNNIRSFQSWLNANYKTGIGVDGLYGNNTEKAAVKALQTELNKQYGSKLAVDGLFGSKTESAIRTVKEGAKGNITRIIQGMMYCLGYNPKGFDGVFGNGCESAVKQFQKKRGLLADGIVGKITFSEMFE